jgi:GxxExxY protein
MANTLRLHNGFSKLSHEVIGSAIEVHRTLGPGLMESTYRRCLAHELVMRGIGFIQEHPLAVVYKGMELDCGYRVDLFVEGDI